MGLSDMATDGVLEHVPQQRFQRWNPGLEDVLVYKTCHMSAPRTATDNDTYKTGASVLHVHSARVSVNATIVQGHSHIFWPALRHCTRVPSGFWIL